MALCKYAGYAQCVEITLANIELCELKRSHVCDNHRLFSGHGWSTLSSVQIYGFTNALLLFSPWALQNNLSSRLGNLLGIQVDSTDGLPHIIYSKCKKQFLTLEKASENLTAFQKMAQESFHAFSVRGDLKRKKECSTASAVGISPDIVRARPPLKRLTAKRLEFNSKLTKLLLLIQQNDNS